MRILVLNGPNLNRLGMREPETYGSDTLDDIVSALRDQAALVDVELSHFQSNAEHELIERIHRSHDEGIDAILFNPAAFTHTSVALRDALLAVRIPFVEIHISNIHAREDFRRHSYFSDIAIGVVSGFGPRSYQLGLMALAQSKGNQRWT